MPAPNKIYKSYDFTVRVIDPATDPANKNEDGSFKREPWGESVVYEYLTGPTGKIGRCKTVDGFHACFGTTNYA